MKLRARHSHGRDKLTQDPFCFFNTMAFQQIADDLSKLLPQPVTIEKCRLMTKGAPATNEMSYRNLARPDRSTLRTASTDPEAPSLLEDLVR